jgi:large subunit ribosomal protein L21
MRCQPDVDFPGKNVYLSTVVARIGRFRRWEAAGEAMYSIIELNNKQYKVEFGKPFLVDNLSVEPDKEIQIDKVLLFRDDKDEIKVGTPYIKDMQLTAKVLGNSKGKKVRVFKYKKRKDYRRTRGARPEYTRILIEKA